MADELDDLLSGIDEVSDTIVPPAPEAGETESPAPDKEPEAPKPKAAKGPKEPKAPKAKASEPPPAEAPSVFRVAPGKCIHVNRGLAHEGEEIRLIDVSSSEDLEHLASAGYLTRE